MLRATHGTRVEELTRTPRMRPGEGITGVAAAERAPVMLAEQAHLDPRFKSFANLPEDDRTRVEVRLLGEHHPAAAGLPRHR